MVLRCLFDLQQKKPAMRLPVAGFNFISGLHLRVPQRWHGFAPLKQKTTGKAHPQSTL